VEAEAEENNFQEEMMKGGRELLPMASHGCEIEKDSTPHIPPAGVIIKAPRHKPGAQKRSRLHSPPHGASSVGEVRGPED
jgi:hypothetical protein